MITIVAIWAHFYRKQILKITGEEYEGDEGTIWTSLICDLVTILVTVYLTKG